VLYSFFILGAWGIKLFNDFPNWPRTPRFALVSSPALILIGVVINPLAARLGYWMIAPVLAYTTLAVVARIAMMTWHKNTPREDAV